MSHDLSVLVEQATSQLLLEYERISARTAEDPGTAGDQGEENWAEVLRKWLPAGYHVVTKGRILSAVGEASPQIDVLVLSPSYPVGLLNTKLYLAAGVVAAFECKLTLRRQHIARAVRTAVRVNELIGRNGSTHRIVCGLLAHREAMATKRASAADRVGEALYEADLEHVELPEDRLDFLCIASLGTWSWSFMRFSNQPDGVTRPEGASKLDVVSAYMGPTEPVVASEEHPEWTPNSLGRLLAGLIRRLSDSDSGLIPIADYLSDAKLFGIGGGRLRVWDLETVRHLRTSIV